MKKDEKRNRESEILDLFFGRDEKALELVSERYGRLFRRIALNLTADEMTADEVLNDTYLALWNSIPPARPENLSAYGSAVARNIAISRVRKDSAGKRAQAVEELDEAAPESGLPEELDDGRLAALIEAFLKTRPKTARAVFVIRYFEEEPIEAIAERTGMSVTAVKSSLLRTRRGLREYLEREGYKL